MLFAATGPGNGQPPGLRCNHFRHEKARNYADFWPTKTARMGGDTRCNHFPHTGDPGASFVGGPMKAGMSRRIPVRDAKGRLLGYADCTAEEFHRAEVRAMSRVFRRVDRAEVRHDSDAG